MSLFVPIPDICEPLVWSNLFGNDHPIEIDLGAGDGDFFLAYAARYPGRNFLAVERLLGRAGKIDRKGRRRELLNLRVLRLESAYTIRYLCPTESVEVVHLMFPDPWPKQKHRKQRLLQTDFAQALIRALKPGGEFRFTTDHEEYFQTSTPILDALPGWKREDVWDLTDYPQTDFEQKWLAEGRSTFRARWRKIV
jgi:tRNA (guanine-N7-)-methyltransferase